MRINHFLEGKTFLVTGATGFLGQPLVEKILFSAPGVRRIYVLIRPKIQFGGRVITPQQRLQKDLYQSSVFDRLRARYGADFELFLEEKLVAVAGDVSQEDLGITEDTRQQLFDEVDVVINSAAVVSFDAPLDQALELNVLAARRVLHFAKKCQKAILVHISTAYVSGATHKETPETLFHSATEDSDQVFPLGKIRDVEDDISKIREIINQVLEEGYSPERNLALKKRLVRDSRRSRRGTRSLRAKMDRLRNAWLQERLVESGMSWARERGWNDTYTYSKALGEQVVARGRETLPTIILRPSVIESSLFEPCPGWLDGLRMADPLIVAIGKGRLRALPLDPQVPLDLVPADIVVNACLAALPHAATQGGLNIYQVATGSENPITLGELYRLIFAYFKKHPMLDKRGQPIRIRPLKFPRASTFRLQHTLKRVPLDTAERTLGRLQAFESTERIRRRVSAARVAHQKLFYYGQIYEPYLNLTCRFKINKTVELFHSLGEEDQRQFNFDVTRINWRHYIQNVHIPGVKKYILKMEGAGTMELEADKAALPVSTIIDLVDYSAQRFGKKTSLQIQRDGRLDRFSFEELSRQMREIGELLGRLGLRKGDRVILFSENQPEWACAFLGAAWLGLIVVPVDPQAWHREVWSLAEFTESRAIMASPKCLARLPEASLLKNEESATPLLLLNLNQSCRPFDLEKFPRSSSTQLIGRVKRGGQHRKTGPDDPVSIIFTSGTAVDPKGAVHSHRTFLNNLYGVNSYLSLRHTDQLLSVLPLYHALEFTCGLLMAIFGGATVTYTQSFKPRLVFQTMRQTGTTCLLAVPTFFALLRDDLERRVLSSRKSALKLNLLSGSKRLSRSLDRNLGKNVGRHLFSKVHEEFGGKIRLLVSGGSALGEELFEDFRALGMPIHEGYGLTETAPVLTVSPYNLARANSAGKPLPGVEIRLDYPDENGAGEIVVRSPSLMREYYRNPEATRRAVEDGWFRTGDLGWVDIDGFLYITGRTKSVIVTGAGKNVYVDDLEAIYGELGGVAAIAVAGVKRGLTEEVHAVIETSPKDSREGSVELQDRIRATVRESSRELPSYQRLQHIHFWEDGIPRRADGSIDRRRLHDKLHPKGEGGRTRASSQSRQRASDEQVLMEELSRISSCPAEGISAATDLYTDLGLDSLQAIELLLFLEHEFSLSVPDERASQLRTVGDILGELERLAGGRREIAQDLELSEREGLVSMLPFEERDLSDRLLLRASHSFIWLLFRTYFRLSVENLERVPGDNPFIVAANHSSHLDSGAIIAALETAETNLVRRLHVLGARDYFFRSRIKGWLVSRTLNVVPIERREASLSSLRVVKKMLDSGEGVLIFPEGTRSRSGRLQAFKAGLGLMALETETDIIPAYISGTGLALPVGAFFPRPRRIRVVFGAPLKMEDYAADVEDRRDNVYRQIATDARQAIARLADPDSTAEESSYQD